MSKPTLPKVAKPRYAAAWDTWNSSSTGHQRPEIQPGTGWREVRAVKLTSQFQAGGSGGQRLLHTNPFFKYGDEDENCGEGVNGKSVVDMLRNPGVMQETLGLSGSTQAATQETKIANSDQPLKGIFTGLTIYINGSTFPLVSDHKLKMLLSEHGANMAMHLGRRRVTHVILGRPSGRGLGGGGGLAGGKLDKEIRKIGGCGIKFVGVEWILESIKAGKRLPEARFSNLKIASKNQGSVFELSSKSNTMNIVNTANSSTNVNVANEDEK